jgi:hypothetical protein
MLTERSSSEKQFLTHGLLIVHDIDNAGFSAVLIQREDFTLECTTEHSVFSSSTLVLVEKRLQQAAKKMSPGPAEAKQTKVPDAGKYRRSRIP